MPKINNDLYRTLVLTILAGMSVLIMTAANRSVYSKEVVDSKFESVDTRFVAVDKQMGHMEEDVRWLVRRMGGVPSVEAEDDSDPSQLD